MRSKLIAIHIIVVVAAGILAGGCSSSEPRLVPTPTLQDPPALRSDKSKPGPALPARAAANVPAGPAFLAIEGEGIFRIEGGKTTLVAPLRDVQQLVLSADGTLYALAGMDGVVHFAKGVAPGVRLDSMTGFMHLDKLAAGPSGALWALGLMGIYHYDGKVWSKEEKSVLGGGSLTKDIAVDPAGRPIIATSNALFIKDGGAWRPVRAPKDTLSIEALTASNGTVFALRGSSVLRVVDDGAESLSLASMYSSSHFGVFGEEVHAVSKGEIRRLLGERVQVIKAQHAGFTAAHPNAVAVDGEWRTWVATEHGLVVVDVNGKATEFPFGTLGNFGGNVKHLVVSGRGPLLPKPLPRATATIQGIVKKAGAGLIGQKLELCVGMPVLFSKGETPCASAPWRGQAQSASDGTYRFDDVPLGIYHVVLQGPDGRWTRMGKVGNGMRKGQVVTVGAYSFK